MQVQGPPSTARGVPADTPAAAQVHQLPEQQQPITALEDGASSLEDEEGTVLPVDEVSGEWELSRAQVLRGLTSQALPCVEDCTGLAQLQVGVRACCVQLVSCSVW